MKPAPFAYAKARSLDHAIELLGGSDGRARPRRRPEPDRHAQHAARRAAACWSTSTASPASTASRARTARSRSARWCATRRPSARADIAQHAPLIALALPHIGHPAIRNRGTIGGSIAFADPAAELPACLLALGGEVEIAGPKGRRTVKADDFFKGLFETALGPRRRADRDPRSGRDAADALRLRRVRAPPRRLRHGRPRRLRAAPTAQGLRTSASSFSASARRRCAPATPRPRSPAATLETRVAALADDLDPPDDMQATGAAKKHLAGVLLRRVARATAEPRA